MNPRLQFVTRHVVVCRREDGTEAEMRRFNRQPSQKEISGYARNVETGSEIVVRIVRIPEHAVFHDDATNSGLAII